MKKLFTLIFAFMLVSPVFAQHSRFSRQFQRSKQPNSTLYPTKQFHANTKFHKKGPLAILQKMDSSVEQEYDDVNNRWVNSWLEEFSYDAYGYNTIYFYSDWNPVTQLYEPVERQELSYSDGLLMEQAYFEWDDFTRNWEPAAKLNFSYDGAGNMVLAYTYIFDYQDWILYQKDECTYNGNGNMTLQISSFWDESRGEWLNGIMEERTYNSSGFLTVSATSYWDYSTNIWLNGEKSENIYNGKEPQIIEKIYSLWSEDISQWISIYKDKFTYDANMNLVLVLDQEWSGSQWINSYKTEFTYNNDYPFNELIIPWMYMEEWEPLINHMLVEMIGWEYDGSSTVLSYKNQYNFSEINITGINNIESNQVDVYPQPANGYVTFQWQSSNPASVLDLYDINGRRVLQKSIEKNKAVDIHHLAPGLYFYRLTDNLQHSISGKMSVR